MKNSSIYDLHFDQFIVFLFVSKYIFTLGILISSCIFYIYYIYSMHSVCLISLNENLIYNPRVRAESNRLPQVGQHSQNVVVGAHGDRWPGHSCHVRKVKANRRCHLAQHNSTWPLHSDTHCYISCVLLAIITPTLLNNIIISRYLLRLFLCGWKGNFFSYFIKLFPLQWG